MPCKSCKKLRLAADEQEMTIARCKGIKAMRSLSPAAAHQRTCQRNQLIGKLEMQPNIPHDTWISGAKRNMQAAPPSALLLSGLVKKAA
jgi:hypothetical protein